jgi:hypothetical protein
MVDERQQGVKPEAMLEVRGRALLLRMGGDQGGIQINDHRIGARDRRAVTPGCGPRRGASPADCGDHRRRILTQGVDEPADRRVRGHRAEQLRLGANDRGIGQAVTAQRDRHCQIQHRLARIMHRSRRPPRTQRVRELLGQSADLGRLQQ